MSFLLKIIGKKLLEFGNLLLLCTLKHSNSQDNYHYSYQFRVYTVGLIHFCQGHFYFCILYTAYIISHCYTLSNNLEYSSTIPVSPPPLIHITFTSGLAIWVVFLTIQDCIYPFSFFTEFVLLVIELASCHTPTIPLGAESWLPWEGEERT